MKKIIDGKKYDTDTATEVGEWSSGESVTDFHYFSETLYRKRGGEYFLHGCGGGLSRYAERCGDMWGWGETIIPLTFEAAAKWGEENLDADEYEAEFGEVSEEGGEEVVSCKVKPAAKRALERFAAEKGLTQAQALEQILLGIS